MAKLTRVLQKLFGLNGASSHFEQFGSKAAGASFLTKDPASIQALNAFINNGWKDAIIGGNKAPLLEDMNALFLVAFYQLAQIFQDGIPVWEAGTTYYVGSIVRKDGTFEQYGSLTNDNINNVLPNQTANGNWTYLNPPSVQPGIISACGAGAPFGYLVCDGTAYANASYPALSTYLGGIWNTFNGAASPGAGAFRVPDLRGLTLLGVGTGTGLTARALAVLIGEENHVLDISQVPVHSHVLNDPGHNHNTWSAGVGAAQQNVGQFGRSAPNDAGTSSTNVTGITMNNSGGGAAHNNMQPSVGINWAIKT